MKVTKTGIAKTISDLMSDHEPPMTIKDLVKKTGIGETKLKSVVADYVDTAGYKRILNIDELLLVAEALGVSPYKVLTGIDDENHVVCEELGLSNDSINTLKVCSRGIQGFDGVFEKAWYPTVPKMIDILLDGEGFNFIRKLYAFIVDDFENVHILDEHKNPYEDRTIEQVIPIDRIAGLNKEQLERVAAFQMTELVLKLRESYRASQKGNTNHDLS